MYTLSFSSCTLSFSSSTLYLSTHIPWMCWNIFLYIIHVYLETERRKGGSGAWELDQLWPCGKNGNLNTSKLASSAGWRLMSGELDRGHYRVNLKFYKCFYNSISHFKLILQPHNGLLSRTFDQSKTNETANTAVINV